MASVLRLATLCQWMTYHTHWSKRSAAGFPDLVMVRRGRLVIAELKRERGRLSADQPKWLDAFAQVPSAEVHVWRPSDWDAIVRVLQ